MRSFNFKLNALLRLKESKRDQALTKFAQSIKEVKRTTENLDKAQKKYHTVQSLLGKRRLGVFRSNEMEALQTSLIVERENVAKAKLQCNQAKEMESARRKIFLEKDSEFKAMVVLREKKMEEHYFMENKKEELELEDVIGSRFLFQRIRENF